MRQEIITFQWAPTLGGECYITGDPDARTILYAFQWAPTLGGECYADGMPEHMVYTLTVSMGTHPWG